MTIGVNCLAKSASTIGSTNTGFIKYTNSAGTTSMSLDVTNYFTSATGDCTYTQCSIVDGSGNSISWLSGTTFSGNICSFNIDTSTT